MNHIKYQLLQRVLLDVVDLLVLVLFTNICFTTSNSQIYDPNNKRYEVPIQTPTVSTQATELDYDVNVNTFPFGISVKRKSTNTVMWVNLFTFLLFHALNVVLFEDSTFLSMVFIWKLDVTKNNYNCLTIVLIFSIFN